MRLSWAIVLLMFFLLFVVVLVTQVYASTGTDPFNIDMIRLQKQQMFGFNYQGNYSQWFGFRGYGYGLSVGNVGIVYGTKVKDVKIRLPGYDEFEIDGIKFKEPKYFSLGDLYIDGFTYMHLDGFHAYGFRDVSKWLFWELSVWFAR